MRPNCSRAHQRDGVMVPECVRPKPLRAVHVYGRLGPARPQTSGTDLRAGPAFGPPPLAFPLRTSAQWGRLSPEAAGAPPANSRNQRALQPAIRAQFATVRRKSPQFAPAPPARLSASIWQLLAAFGSQPGGQRGDKARTIRLACASAPRQQAAKWAPA